MMTDTLAQLPVIIVGGGLSGLSAAAILARAGHAVSASHDAGVHQGAEEHVAADSGEAIQVGDAHE